MNARLLLPLILGVTLAHAAAPLVPRTYPETILVAKRSTPIPFFDDVPVDRQQIEAELAALKERQAALDARLRQLAAERDALVKRQGSLQEKLTPPTKSSVETAPRELKQP